ncbi:uncharacterized protein K02A2.6-like [Culex quinquefasciatus]|uniref:uncharacterized protein K02A2.6-like n=1 Tax=Culex quinquefasciatus TaxID=7176 RepID=UPI0018E3534A|nr:uncharacterized protein K02A2.6-like [Culex quinquefasciatus]
MAKITAKETVLRLDKIFTRLGYPQTITLDNAKQFVGVEIQEYCKTHGIYLNHSAPYWPQENGLVEKQNRSLLKRLKISHALNRDWKQDLREYLVMYYTTPHSTTGKTPTEMMYGRTIRSKIPAISDIDGVPLNTEEADRDRILKQKGKENEDARRNARRSSISTGDTVLMQNLLPGNKLTTTFSPTEYTVVSRDGPRATIHDSSSGKSFERNVAHLKRIGKPVAEDEFTCEAGAVENSVDVRAGDIGHSNPIVGDELQVFVDSEEPEPEQPRKSIRPLKKPARWADYVSS